MLAAVLKNDVTQFMEARVPPGRVALWWLGQSGFLVKSPSGITVAIDPYLSNSCKAVGETAGFDMDRLVPPPVEPRGLLGIELYCITHSHQDHLDPETVGPYLAAGGTAKFIAPAESVENLLSLGVDPHRIEMIWPNKTTTAGDLSVRATFAIPLGGDDLTHVGYLVSIEGGPRIYFTGDTAYHDVLVDAVSAHRPDVLVTVINGDVPEHGACRGRDTCGADWRQGSHPMPPRPVSRQPTAPADAAYESAAAGNGPRLSAAATWESFFIPRGRRAGTSVAA